MKINPDFIAASMESLMQNPEYLALFNKPMQVKQASKKAESTVLELLLQASEQLDSLGLEKSAAFVLEAVEEVLNELNDSELNVSLERENA